MPLDADHYEAKAAVVAALAHPVRLRLLERMAHGEVSTGQLAETLGLPQPLVSQHLTVLRSHGVVQRRRLGSHQLYRLADPRIAQACALVGEIVAHLRTAPLARSAPAGAAAP